MGWEKGEIYIEANAHSLVGRLVYMQPIPILDEEGWNGGGETND